jgi:hypothetical protein
MKRPSTKTPMTAELIENGKAVWAAFGADIEAQLYGKFPRGPADLPPLATNQPYRIGQLPKTREDGKQAGTLAAWKRALPGAKSGHLIPIVLCCRCHQLRDTTMYAFLKGKNESCGCGSREQGAKFIEEKVATVPEELDEMLSSSYENGENLRDVAYENRGYAVLQRLGRWWRYVVTVLHKRWALRVWQALGSDLMSALAASAVKLGHAITAKVFSMSVARVKASVRWIGMAELGIAPAVPSTMAKRSKMIDFAPNEAQTSIIERAAVHERESQSGLEDEPLLSYHLTFSGVGFRSTRESEPLLSIAA